MLAPLPAEVLASQLPGHDVVGVGRDDDPVTACRGADVVVSDWTAHHRVAGAVVEALAPTCRLVQVPAAGLDGVDVPACAAAGIPVASAAGLNAGTVAEWCVWGALTALRGLAYADRALREGRWEQVGHARYELAGKVVGIVGLGDIGRAAARRFGAFGVELRYWTRTRRPPEVEAELAVSWSELDELVRDADVLVLAIALTPDTEGLLDGDRLATMKPNAVVVNASRGAVTDEAALAAAVREGRLHGAAVDVFTEEPPRPDHPLVGLDAVAVSPHIAGATAESITRMFLERVLGNVTAVLDGRDPAGRVT